MKIRLTVHNIKPWKQQKQCMPPSVNPAAYKSAFQTVAVTNCKQWLAILQVQDFATVVFRMKALGFNTIKLPFSFDALKANPQGLYGACSSIASNDALKAGLTEGGKGSAPLLMLLPGFYVYEL